MARLKELDMTEGPLFPKIIGFAVPLMLSNALQQLFNAADLAVVGHYSENLSSSVAAVGATGSLVSLITNFFIGLSIGSGVSVAHAKGANDQERLSKTIHTAIPTAIISGLIVSVVGVFLCRYFLTLMHTPDEIIDLAAVYLRTYFCGTVAVMLYNFGASILRALGDAKRPLIFLMIAGVLNLLLNLFFVIVLHMDVMGVALATVLSNVVGAVLVLITLMRRTDGGRFMWSQMRIYAAPLKNILRIGLPAGMQSLFLAYSNVMVQSSINSFQNKDIVAGNSAVANVDSIIWTMGNSFTQAAMNFMGQNMGARKYDRIGKIVRICIGSVIVFTLTTSVAVLLGGRFVLSFYIKDSAAAIEAGLVRISTVTLFYVLCCIMDVFNGIMRGMGYSFVPMVITITGTFVIRIGWIYTFFQMEMFHNYRGVLLVLPVSWVLADIASIICYLIIKRRVIIKAQMEDGPAQPE